MVGDEKMSLDWKDIEETIKEIQTQRGIKPIKQLPEGETIVEIDLHTPVEKRNTRFGERFVIPLLDGTVLMLSPTSALLRQLVDVVKKNQGKSSVKVKILRVGTGRLTRYSVKEA